MFTGEHDCLENPGDYSGVLYVEWGYEIDLRGGSFAPGATFCVGDSSKLNVYGTDLSFTNMGGEGVVTGLLTGTLLDGSELSVEILLGGSMRDPGELHLFNVPEPTTGLLVFAGLLGLAGWRRVRA